MINQSPLIKKTKAEILNEYNLLLERYEELKAISKTLGEPQNLELLEKAKSNTFDKIKESADGLKNELSRLLNEITEKQMVEAEKLNEIQRAVEFSRKNLEVNYGIQVAADTLKSLVEENENKKKEFEKELILKKSEIEDELWRTKKNWEREQEEYEYNTGVKRRRDEEDFGTTKTQKEKELFEREESIKIKEEEIQNMRRQIEAFPKQLGVALEQREHEVVKRLNVEFENKISSLKKDWQAEKNLLEMQAKNSDELLKRQDIEINKLRKELENAQYQTQQIAVKIVESGAKISTKQELENSDKNWKN